MTDQDFHCRQCGNCCRLAYFGEVTGGDVQSWKDGDRADILAWIRVRSEGDDEHIFEVWFDPETGEAFEGCPWLKKHPGSDRYDCLIYDVRPVICRHFPASRKHGKEIGCQGFDRKPLQDS
jgi:Fe-S-cluster containining protein